MQFKNVSEKPFVLNDVDWFWGWTTHFEDMTRNGPWQLRLRVVVENGVRKSTIRTCKPGETAEVTVDLSNQPYQYEFTWAGRVAGQAVLPLKQLHPGKYRLTIDIPLKEPQHSQQEAPFWTGTITTKPVEFEISDKPAATQPATELNKLVGQEITLTGTYGGPGRPADYITLNATECVYLKGKSSGLTPKYGQQIQATERCGMTPATSPRRQPMVAQPSLEFPPITSLSRR